MLKICVIISVVVSCGLCYEVQPFIPNIFKGGYAPYYDLSQGRLLLVDFFAGQLININYNTKQTFIATVDGIAATTFLIPLKKNPNQFLISNKCTASIVEWFGTEPVAKVVQDTFTIEAAPGYELFNYNMAKASPKGTFFGGTFRGSICANTSEPMAEFVSYSQKCGVKKVDIPNLKASSGIVWNAAATKMFHASSCEKVIRVFNYDAKTGKISNGQILFTYQGQYGDPDRSRPLGMTIDVDGFLYVVIYFGGVILKIDSNTGRIVLVIQIPAEIVADVTWAGPNYDVLIVTTWSTVLEPNTATFYNGTISPNSGMVFSITGLNARGLPANAICI